MVIELLIWLKSCINKQVKELSEIVAKKVDNKKEELAKEISDLVQNKEHAGSVKSAVEPYSTSNAPMDLASGCIINTMLTHYESPEKTIQKVANDFKADYIIIIDYEKMYIKLAEEYRSNPHLKLIKLPRSSGVIAIDEMQRQILKNQSFKRYFSGKTGDLYTFELGLNLNEYRLYTVEIVTIPLSALPTGAKADLQKIMVKRADPSNLPLQNKVIGVLDPVDVEKLEKWQKDIEEGESTNKEEFYDMVVKSLCRSLIYVSSYEPDKNTLIVIATTQELQSKHLIIGDITYEKDI